MMIRERSKGFCHCLISVLLLMAAACSEPSPIGGNPPPRPNILFILADNLGWRDVGYHGSEIQTPNLDRMAHAGVRMEQHYVYPVCYPTRVALMTGRCPTRFPERQSYAHTPFSSSTLTLASALREAGYETAISGKWHLGYAPVAGPLSFGFDHTYGVFGGGIHPYNHVYNPGPYSRTWHRNDRFVDEEGHATDLITAEAIRFIQTPRDRPFFLYLPYTAVHLALVEPEKWLSLYPEDLQPCRRSFAAAASHMDDAIGQVMGALERSGQVRNTLVVFSSDNGGQEHWAEFGGEIYGSPHPRCPVLGDNRPLRGWQTQVYEGGIRVPAFVYWPGTLKPGMLNGVVSILDWVPTLASLAGYVASGDPSWDGRDVWPWLVGKTTPSSRTLHWRGRDDWGTPHDRLALRQGDWKLVARERGGEIVNQELYDLAQDPSEERDLASAHRERVRELEDLLKAQLRLDAASQEQLRP